MTGQPERGVCGVKCCRGLPIATFTCFLSLSLFSLLHRSQTAGMETVRRSSFSATLYHITRLEIEFVVILHCDRRKWEEGWRW
ncbi:hypothetical protein F5883DRAFT_268526 [Diaporthe sp. PMI_573]|nr:hypothetical protein F5883DRAFT_268526 [Diaporthaceae sp. PMI_573]